MNFASYIKKTQTRLEQTRPEATPEIIAANLPFELKPATNPTKNGILLIHGLLDSPCTLRSLAEHFQSQGFLVRVLLLPGHGSVPSDLLKVTLEQWLTTTEQGIASFVNEVENIFVMGFSTGANLAIYQALCGAKLAGLILFAPGLQLKSHVGLICSCFPIAKRLCKRCQWLRLHAETDYAKYRSIAYNAVCQVHRSGQEIKALNKKQLLTIPHLMVLTDVDEAISSEVALQFFIKQAEPNSQLLLYSSAAKQTPHERVQIINSAFPEKNIVDFSHVCLTIAPNHPHYGQAGDIEDFSHYKTFWGWPFKKSAETPVTLGAVHLKNLLHYRLQRLSYNPDFANLTQKIDAFIKKIIP